MSSLTIDALHKRFGTFTAVRAFALAVEEGEFVSLLGPSGCGKTTILRIIAGLVEPDGGRIRIGEREVTDLPAHKRNIGLVFQSYALFPHMSVFENVAFGLRRRRVAEAEIRRRVDEALAMVRLDAHSDRLPAQLSGGQQQRVALARAIAPRPALLLLDEPLSNLDAQLRESMQVELKRLQRELGVTTVFVTHDQAEALALSDRVCVLNQGALQQIGSPVEIYHHPANSFVASFLGRSNRLDGVVVEAAGEGLRIRLAGGLEVRAGAAPVSAGQRVRLTLRQESVRLGTAPASGLANAFRGRIAFRAFTGSSVDYLVALDGGPEILVEAASERGLDMLEVGATVWASWEPGAAIVLPEEGEAA